MIRKGALTIVFSTLIGFVLTGQDRSEIVKVYNDGVKQIQTNIDSAIMSFESVISMSEKAGETANDLKQNATQALPGLYVKSASAKLSNKRPGPEVVMASKKAVAYAEKSNNAQAKDNASKVLVQAYNRMATEFFTGKDYEKALLTFDSVLAINPDNLPAIYNKALVYRAQGNSDALEQTVDLYLTKLPATDQEKRNQASKMALEYFRASGSKISQAGQLDEALNTLNKAAKYGEDKDLYYYFADVYNKKEDFDKGAEAAGKGLALETGTPEAKAKFYFQLATAQAGKGQTAEACESYKNAMYPPFADASKAQRTNLKCK